MPSDANQKEKQIVTTSQHTATVGFIGLGDQGAPMAQAIGDSGFGLHVSAATSGHAAMWLSDWRSCRRAAALRPHALPSHSRQRVRKAVCDVGRRQTSRTLGWQCPLQSNYHEL